MELRLSGTREECADLAAVLPDLLGDVADIQRVSRFYPDHDPGTHPSPSGRVYVHLSARTVQHGTRSRSPRALTRRPA